MGEALQDSVDQDTQDWKASDFGEADLVTDGEVATMVEAVADGGQDDASDAEEPGWALSPAERAALPKGVL